MLRDAQAQYPLNIVVFYLFGVSSRLEREGRNNFLLERLRGSREELERFWTGNGLRALT